MAVPDDPRIHALLADLVAADGDRELVDRYDKAVEELSQDQGALENFLGEAAAAGLSLRVYAAKGWYLVRDRILTDAFRSFRGEVPSLPDDLTHAEQQMAEEEFAKYQDLFDGAMSRLRAQIKGPGTEAEVQAVFDQWLAEDPGARDLAESLAVFYQFRNTPREEE